MADFSGHLDLRASGRPHGRTVLSAQSFRAPYHLSKPYWDTATGTLLVQVVNPTAGILSGDQLSSSIRVDAAAALLVTTPSASRVFKMKTGTASCRQAFHVAAGGWLEWMPEPLVPHRGCSYHQTTTVDVAAGGELFFSDLLMPGRVAHGEAWEWNQLCLVTSVRLDGELILQERFAQTGESLRALASLAQSGSGACFGNAVLVTARPPDDVAWRSALHALQAHGLWIGVSALRRGGWSIKWVAANGVQLRQAFRDIRRILAGAFPRLACDPRKL